MEGKEIACSIRQLHNLSEWASSLKQEDLPMKVEERARSVLLDDLGAILCGSLEPEVCILRERLLKSYQNNHATVLTKGFPRTDLFTAAELNGIAACWLELDEGYSLAPSHAGIYTIPGLLALAETENASIGQILTALVVGYEFGARFAETWSFPQLLIHPHGAFSSISAAAACAKLRDFSSKELFNAVTTAATLTIASPFDHAPQGALVRNIWTGIGARLGLMTVCLSETQVHGLPDSPYSVFSGIYQGVFRDGYLDQRLGNRYAISHGYHRLYACCRYMHSALEALLTLRSRHIHKGKVAIPHKFVVEIHERGLALNKVHPETTLGAKFSVPHAIAAAWVLGDAGYRAFRKETLNDPIIRQLREKISLKPIEKETCGPHDERPARITIIFAHGNSDQSYAANSVGDPDRPFDQQMLYAKFASMTTNIFSHPDKVSQHVLNAPAKLRINDMLSIYKRLQIDD